MKYILKTLTDAEGYDTTCHVALEGGFNLAASTASLTVKGWKDVAAFNAGKSPKLTNNVAVDLLSISTTCGDLPAAMTVYEALWLVMATRLVSDPAGVFYGGTIEDTDEADEPIVDGTTIP